jgi:hypothetical protein
MFYLARGTTRRSDFAPTHSAIHSSGHHHHFGSMEGIRTNRSTSRRLQSSHRQSLRKLRGSRHRSSHTKRRISLAKVQAAAQARIRNCSLIIRRLHCRLLLAEKIQGTRHILPSMVSNCHLLPGSMIVSK